VTDVQRRLNLNQFVRVAKEIQTAETSCAEGGRLTILR